MKSFLERASGCGTGILPVSFPGGQDAHSTDIDSLPLILCSLFPDPLFRTSERSQFTNFRHSHQNYTGTPAQLLPWDQLFR
ncbi:MAG: hypothetical protein F6K37_40535 [Moorea sp. SIO4E2]|uniref:hypothetical protein n=1 Tax=Moorena sp. SIO4E2 TaxID=2607826 RepID=UPI0013B74C7D|nr:hypothetical protein [Moorena sp. SIO4E2]NEQ11926.1 hypothetical protein [Moorena sp. SIO4E2]